MSMNTRDENWLFDVRNMTLLEIAEALRGGRRLDNPALRQVKAIIAMSEFNQVARDVKSDLSEMRCIFDEMATSDDRETDNELQQLNDFKASLSVFDYAYKKIDLLRRFVENTTPNLINDEKPAQKGAEQ